MINIHKNSIDYSKWTYEINEGELIFQLQKLSSVIKVDVKCENGECSIVEANILIIYTDKF